MFLARLERNIAHTHRRRITGLQREFDDLAGRSVRGNVSAAMRLGDQIRTLQARTVTAYQEAVIQDDRRVATGRTSCTFWEGNGYVGIKPVQGHDWCTCASACFLVWASGATREGGHIGIHRFYYSGSDFGNLPPQQAREMYRQAQDEFRAYGRDGEPCDRCGTQIVKTRAGGRGTWYCPTCQAASSSVRRPSRSRRQSSV